MSPAAKLHGLNLWVTGEHPSVLTSTPSCLTVCGLRQYAVCRVEPFPHSHQVPAQMTKESQQPRQPGTGKDAGGGTGPRDWHRQVFVCQGTRTKESQSVPKPLPRWVRFSLCTRAGASPGSGHLAGYPTTQTQRSPCHHVFRGGQRPRGCASQSQRLACR